MQARFLPVLILLLFISPATALSQTGSIDELVILIGKGDAKGMADQFSSTIELNMFGEEEVHSKAQAELIMRDFFNKNKPGVVRLQHKLNSNSSQHLGVITMNSSDKKFRISVSMIASGQRYLIKEMRIELDRQ